MDLPDFATRYTAAWCSVDAASVAAFFSPSGSLTINDGPPAIGRVAITEVAQSFMTAFPDLIVSMDSIEPAGDTTATYHWTLTGTNSAPGGTGHRVRISGHEQWHLSPDGLIAQSLGHFNAAEYARQLKYSSEDPT